MKELKSCSESAMSSWLFAKKKLKVLPHSKKYVLSSKRSVCVSRMFRFFLWLKNHLISISNQPLVLDWLKVDSKRSNLKKNTTICRISRELATFFHTKMYIKSYLVGVFMEFSALLTQKLWFEAKVSLRNYKFIEIEAKRYAEVYRGSSF